MGTLLRLFSLVVTGMLSVGSSLTVAPMRGSPLPKPGTRVNLSFGCKQIVRLAIF